MTLCAGGPGHALRPTPLQSSLPLPSPLPPSSRSQAYLPRVGPPNLRFAWSKPPLKAASLQDSLARLNAEAAVKSAVADTSNNLPIPTNAAPVADIVLRADSTPSSAKLLGTGLDTSGADPVIVTPAMLAEFLKASASHSGGRNSGGRSRGDALPNLDFKPPLPPADNQNHVDNKSE